MPEEDASTAMPSDANSSVVQPADVWQSDNEATALGFPSDIVSEGGLREGTNIREMDSTLSRPAEEEARGYAGDTGWARSFFENTYANGMGPAGPKRAPHTAQSSLLGNVSRHAGV